MNEDNSVGDSYLINNVNAIHIEDRRTTWKVKEDFLCHFLLKKFEFYQYMLKK